jgi:HEAT repeat protein
VRPSRRQARRDNSGEDRRTSHSERRRTSRRHGVSSSERQEVFSDPPAHTSGDSLDDFGNTDHYNRERKNQRKNKLVPIILVCLAVLLAIIGAMIPGMIKKEHLRGLQSSSHHQRAKAVHNLVLKPASMRALQANVASGDLEGRGGSAATALARMPNGITFLTEASKTPLAPGRLCAAYGLGLTRKAEAVAPLVALLEDSSEKPEVRLQAAEALGMIPSPQAVSALINQVEATDQLAVAVGQAILAAASPDSLSNLTEGLGSISQPIRQACLQGVSIHGDLAAIPDDNIAKLLASGNAAVRAEGVALISIRGGDLCDQQISTAMDDTDEQVRVAAVQAMTLRAGAQATSKLKDIAANEKAKSGIRRNAIAALRRIPGRGTLAILNELLLNDRNENGIRLAAARAMIQVASNVPFCRLPKKGQPDDATSHMALAVNTPDSRWAMVKKLTTASATFASNDLKKAVFAAMNALVGRKIEASTEAWNKFMTKISADAVVLGEISYRIETAFKLQRKNKKRQGIEMAQAALKLARKLFENALPSEKEFYVELLKDINGLLPKSTAAKPITPQDNSTPKTGGQ